MLFDPTLQQTCFLIYQKKAVASFLSSCLLSLSKTAAQLVQKQCSQIVADNKKIRFVNQRTTLAKPNIILIISGVYMKVYSLVCCTQIYFIFYNLNLSNRIPNFLFRPTLLSATHASSSSLQKCFHNYNCYYLSTIYVGYWYRRLV